MQLKMEAATEVALTEVALSLPVMLMHSQMIHPGKNERFQLKVRLIILELFQ